jgi:hypothetical protein
VNIRQRKDFFIRFFLFFFYALVRYQEEQLERMKRDQKTPTTSLVGFSFSSSMVRNQEEKQERMKRD